MSRRKCDTLLFKKDGFEIRVPIYLVREGEGDEETTRYEVDFKAKEPPIHISVRHVDLDTARKMARKLLEQQVGFKWEPWLLIEPRGYSIDKGTVKEENLTLKVTFIQVAEIEPGHYVHRFPDHDQFGSAFKDQIHDGLPGTQEDFGPPHRRREIRSCLPATPENVAAVKSIQDGMAQLRERLTDLLGPKNAQHTLLSIKAIGLLPQPKGTDDEQGQ